MPAACAAANGIGDLDAVVERLLQAKPVSRNQAIERTPRHELHRDEVDALVLVMSWMVTMPG